MKKLTKNQFFTLSILVMLFAILLWSFTYEMHFIGDTPTIDRYDKIINNYNYGMFHTIFNFITLSSWTIFIIVLLANWLDKDLNLFKRCYMSENERKNGVYDKTKGEFDGKKPIKNWKWVVGILLFAFLVFILNITSTVFNGSVKIFNQSKKYQNEYTKRVQEKRGFFDKQWKTYYQKEKIVKLTTETFTAITKLIMENAKDGQNLSWKWVQNYPNIDQNIYAAFYADLSNFIQNQRDGYFKIETDCQEIANKNNTMLDTFPNNYYNRIVGCPRINFEYGFTSDSTENVFKTKRENLK